MYSRLRAEVPSAPSGATFGGFGPPSDTFGYPSGASDEVYLRRSSGDFGRRLSLLTFRRLLVIIRVASVVSVLLRLVSGAGGLPLRQAPRGRRLASSGLKPRLCPEGSRHTVPFSPAKLLCCCFGLCALLFVMNARKWKCVCRGWRLVFFVVDVSFFYWLMALRFSC